MSVLGTILFSPKYGGIEAESYGISNAGILESPLIQRRIMGKQESDWHRHLPMWRPGLIYKAGRMNHHLPIRSSGQLPANAYEMSQSLENTVSPAVNPPSSSMAEDAQLAHQIAVIVDERLAAGLTDLVKTEFKDVIGAIVQEILNSGNVASDSNMVPATATASPAAAATATAPASSQNIGAVASSNHVNALVCPHCPGEVPLADAERRWYAVWRGRRIGWVRGSDNLNDITRGVSGAGFKFCASMEVAKAVFLEKQASKRTSVVNDGVDASLMIAAEDGVLFP
ncbi:hypothetical protein PM082_024729 [Marasmius tenuissimus]|nr:hypothetical protein PM082_024729 [Marasmius tenuissimus]